MMTADLLRTKEAPLQKIMDHTDFSQANFDKGYSSRNIIGKEIRDSEGRTVYFQFEFMDEEKTSRIYDPSDLQIIRRFLDSRKDSSYVPILDGSILRDFTIPNPSERESKLN